MSDNFQLKAILSAVDKMSPSLKVISQTAKNTRKYLLDVGTAAGKLSGSVGLPLAAISAATAGLSAAGMKGAIVGFTEYAEEIKKAAFATGMTTDEIQRMKYVASQSGVDFGAMVDSVGKLNKNLGEVATGGAPELAGLLKHLGVATRDANGHLRGGAEMLPALADAFKRNTNPVLQARMGMAAFGKSWKEVLPMLMEGSDGIAKSYARFKQIGNLTSQADLDAAKEFGDQLSDVSMVTKGFGYTIAKQLIPVLSPLVEDFIQWGAANKKVIAAQVKQFVVELVAGLKSFDWKGFIDNVKSIVSGFGRLVDMVGGAKNALIILAVVMNANAIMATFSLIGAVGRLAFALGGVGLKAIFASAELLAFAAHSAAMATGLTASLLALAGSGALLAAAGAVGFAIGTAIYDNFISGTKLADWLGEQIAGVLAFFGNDTAKSALESNAQKGSSGSGSSILNATQRVGGEINVNFSNAPAGMRVEPAGRSGGVDVNANVGYRGFALGNP